MALTNHKWKSFMFSDLFKTKIGYFNTKPRFVKNGNIPFLGSTDNNNGVSGYTTINIINNSTAYKEERNQVPLRKKLFNSNAIVVNIGGSLGYAYYQNTNYVSTHHTATLELKNHKLNERLAMFFITMIKLQAKMYNFNRAWRLPRLRRSKLLLPVDHKNNIDWDYMESYINQINDKKLFKEKNFINKALPYHSSKIIPSLDKVTKKEFIFKDIFNIGNGALIPKKNLKSGNIQRISVTSLNNGVCGYFQTKNIKKARHFENCISISFLGNAFYHKNLASFDMKVHEIDLKDHKMTENEGLFLSTVINKRFEGIFSYGHQLTNKYLKSKTMKLKLPIQNNGNINWQYINNYINNIKQQKRNKIIK